MLRTPKSTALKLEGQVQKPTKEKKDREVPNKISQWTEAKILVESERKRFLNEEYETKLSLMKDKHDVEISILKEESQERIKKMRRGSEEVVVSIKEERKLKIEILQLKKNKF